MQLKLSTALFLAATASALQVTSPSRGDDLNLNTSNEVTWDYVETDPSSFDIQLVNEHVNPPIQKTIATNVQTSAGSYTFSNVNTEAGKDYQINLVSNNGDNTGILAQSAQFDVSNGHGSSSLFSTSTPTPTSTSTSTSSTSSTPTSIVISVSSSSTSTDSSSISTSTLSSSFGLHTPIASSSATTKTSATSTGFSASSSTATHTGAAAMDSVPFWTGVIVSLVALLI